MPKDGAMPDHAEQVKKYRLGNQSEEYALITDYLGWIPDGFANWDGFVTANLLRVRSEIPKELIVRSPNKQKEVTLILDHALIKDAFPTSFHIEDRAKNWWNFYKVSTKEKPEEQFIIPLH